MRRSEISHCLIFSGITVLCLSQLRIAYALQRDTSILLLVARRITCQPLLVTLEIEITWKFGGQSRVVIDNAFKVDPRYTTVGQQHPERWFPDTQLILGNPGNRKQTLCP